MEELDEQGFIFLDNNHRPFLCAMIGDHPWLCYWHTEGHWVTLRQVNQSEVWQFPQNLTGEQQQLYRDKHQQWIGETSPC